MQRLELHSLGCRLRSLGSTRGDWLTYIDGTLPLLVGSVPVEAKKKPAALECEACADRRRKRTAAQQRWRKDKAEKK